MTRGLELDVSFLSGDTSEVNLPEGWVVKERKRSLVEVETNIRTLGQLFRTLTDLKKQLPSPVAAAVENNNTISLLGQPVKANNHDSGDLIPVTPIDQPSSAQHILSKYPASIFDRLIELHLCCCTSWRDPDQFMMTYRQGRLAPGLMYAIFAHSAIHGMMCHPEAFPQPYLVSLGQDCYQLACDWVEFDVITTSTVEALVTMHLYCSFLQQTTNHHFFALAKRHVDYLDVKGWGFRAWLRRIELATTTLEDPCPFVLNKPQQQRQQQSSAYPTPKSDDGFLDQQQMWMYYEIKGWELIQTSASVSSLQSWMDQSTADMDNTPLWQTLRLQTLYLAGILNRYQADMMDVFERDDRWLLDDQVTDYFSVPTQNRIEQGLHRAMLAGYKLIQVVLYSFKINHRCLLPEMMNIISAAVTILYFGHQVTLDEVITQQAEQALVDLVKTFENEKGMLMNPTISSSVLKWKAMVNSFGTSRTF
ncbi:uncharacterized protein BX664DRAFT_343325 [Halteromyces radiatus]|uniref:uncharacterized protein n=1 Tax=Halteromyces radiatus TaxID=101107 RepID=UPI002220B9B0|nr:uncharacterized protein BX664DRAFT_343325 [Halteromyces radiatus]KAI8077719.1 hypothetical protein BX664DRAFT_343325 [Halteromyces radiatus]